MKNSATKIVRSLLNRKNVEKIIKKLNKKTIIYGISLLILFTISFYLIKPYFYDYNSNINIVEKKIYKQFKLNTKINGKISYKFFPSPRIRINQININFNDKDSPLLLKDANIIIPFFNNNNFNKIKFKKFFVSNNYIEIYTKDFDDYFNYLTLIKNKDIIFKRNTIFFLDDQKNKVVFENFNLNDKFRKDFHSIDIKSFFSENNVKIKFRNNLSKEKTLDIELPQIDTNINIVFDPSSNLSNLKGKSKIKLFDNIIVLNFIGKEKFQIYDSFFRSKFLNSKIEGNISLLKNFLFNIKLQINQIYFRKLLFYYFPENKKFNILNSGISKKINGKFDISIKNSNSFIGRINNFETKLIFENGDLRVQDGSVVLPHKSKLKFNFLFSDNLGDPFLDFNINFYSQDTKKLLRKLNVYQPIDRETKISLEGKINLKKNEIKFRNIISNNREKFDKKDISNIEKDFNKFVLSDGIIGVTDFFKLKKFAKETFN